MKATDGTCKHPRCYHFARVEDARGLHQDAFGGWIWTETVRCAKGHTYVVVVRDKGGVRA